MPQNGQTHFKNLPAFAGCTFVTKVCLTDFWTLCIKVTINPLKSKFSCNLVLCFIKFNLYSFVGIFERILYKENFIVIKAFKTGTTSFAALPYFWKVINPINKCK